MNVGRQAEREAMAVAHRGDDGRIGQVGGSGDKEIQDVFIA